MSLEQILLFAVFLLVPVLSFLGRLLGKHRDGQERRDVEPQRPATVPSAGTVTTPAVREPREGRRALQIPQPTPAPQPLGTRRRSRLGTLSRGKARQGFVLMTILGPCRGLADS